MRSDLQKKKGGRREREGLPCRLHGIKTSEIYSSLDWSGLARFGVASTKKGGHIAGNERQGEGGGADTLQGCTAFLFANFNIETALKGQHVHA